MHQANIWEKEYRNPQLITLGDEPQKDVRRFLRYWKKTTKQSLDKTKVLDLGSGTGRNTNYLASLGSLATGMEISKTAVYIARKRALDMNLKVEYLIHDIGSHYPFPDKTFDIILDITSSNSLDESGRKQYLSEISRVLKPEGYVFVKALCKDGDTNAKALIKKFPGHEKDTYIIKEIGLTERVFSKDDFMNMYSEYFNIQKLDKKTTYTKFRGQSYKRNFWIAYLKNKTNL